MPQPASLMDMFSGKAPLEFNPRDYAGNQIGMGDAIAQNSNSLVGLGMGLLQPYRPGESPYGAALQGFQTGSVADANRGYRTAQLQHQKAQDARQAAQFGAQQARQAREDAYRREQDTLDRDLRERTFARNDPANSFSEAQRAMRDVLPPDATPEQKSTFMRDWYKPKTEGNLAAQFEQRRTIAKAQGLDENDPKVKSWLASGGTLNEEGKPLPAEMSSRVALAGKFLDEAPAIRAKIETGMATDTLEGKAKTYFNAGEQGEIARKVKSGTDALLRSLTGAGMPDAEARKYVARYEITPLDTKDTALSKFDQLHDELTRSEQEAFRGRGGLPRDIIDRRKAAHEGASKATAPGPDAPAPTAGRGGSAPPRPANVPAGSAYSPSRNQWKLPNGQVVDSAGRPI